jgi:hypothetical protein
MGVQPNECQVKGDPQCHKRCSPTHGVGFRTGIDTKVGGGQAESFFGVVCIGFCIENLIVKIFIRSDPSIRTLLRRIAGPSVAIAGQSPTIQENQGGDAIGDAKP